MEYIDYKKARENDTIFVLDSNVFLGLYDMSEDFGNHLIDEIEYAHQKGCLRISPITLGEYDANSLEARNHIARDIKTLSNQLVGKESGIEEAVLKYRLNSKKYELEENVDRADKLLTVIGDLRQMLAEMHALKDAVKPLSDTYITRVEGLVQKLRDDKEVVFDKVSTKEMLDRCEEGNRRYALEFPPGYADKAKSQKSVGSQIRKFGDFFIWKDILEAKMQKDIIFITGDMKEDWWDIPSGGNLADYRARSELILEFKDYYGEKYKIDFLPKDLFLAYSLAITQSKEDNIYSLLLANPESFLDFEVLDDQATDKIENNLISKVKQNPELPNGDLIIDAGLREGIMPIINSVKLNDYNHKEEKATFIVSFRGFAEVNIDVVQGNGVENTYDMNYEYVCSCEVRVELKLDSPDLPKEETQIYELFSGNNGTSFINRYVKTQEVFGYIEVQIFRVETDEKISYFKSKNFSQINESLLEKFIRVIDQHSYSDMNETE
ncbi:PIN-like domain-containing protein [Listeria booriae]|uniref:PIN-like domain-containing protein n=1 Tax=Listeria booriae TaxID=1552123 RepID=UPI0016279163|nr:PIN-like domain-containing protein [Listeria booriae]